MYMCGGFPGSLVVKNPPANAGNADLISEGERFPWRRKRQHTLVFLPRKSHGQRSLVGYSLWGCKRVGHDIAIKHTHVCV